LFVACHFVEQLANLGPDKLAHVKQAADNLANRNEIADHAGRQF
jgi:hypothetical protein